jgi:hypothetical protein
MSELTTLYRPVGPTELERIAELGWHGFPPRLPEQPIFYPVLTESYAHQIARDWNATAERTEYRGYVTRFHVRSAYLADFAIQTVGGREHREYWIPAERLSEFNSNIVGSIEVIAEYRGARDRAPELVKP